MTTLVTIIIILAAIIMVASIFLQPSKGDGFVGGGAAQQTQTGSASSTSFLFKTTMWCIAIIMGGALYLSYSDVRESKSSDVDTLPETEVAEPQMPANASPVTEQSAESEASQKSPAAPSASPQNLAPASPAPKK